MLCTGSKGLYNAYSHKRYLLKMYLHLGWKNVNPDPEEDLAQAGGSAHPAVMTDGGHLPFRPGAEAAWQAGRQRGL